MTFPAPPKPKGNGDRPDVPLPEDPLSRSDSRDSEEADPLRFGLGGTSPDGFGPDSLDGRRGVNECERECTCDEVDDDGVRGGVMGEAWLDIGGPRRVFLGGEVDSSADITGNG